MTPLLASLLLPPVALARRGTCRVATLLAKVETRLDELHRGPLADCAQELAPYCFECGAPGAWFCAKCETLAVGWVTA